MLETIKRILKWIASISGVLILFVLVLWGSAVYQKNMFGNETIYKITDKGIKEGLYVIYTDKGTLNIEDSLLYMQYRSSDVYGGIEKDKCYLILKEMFTYRIPMFSMYPNIIKYKEVDCVKK